jgi:hypothetical protein
MWHPGRLESSNVRTSDIARWYTNLTVFYKQFKLMSSRHRMYVIFASINIIPRMESFSAYPKWISLAIRIFNTSSGGYSEGMLDILVLSFVSQQTYTENYTPSLYKCIFHTCEIKQTLLPHIHTLARSHRPVLCAQMQILRPFTDHPHAHSQHGNCSTDKRSILPLIGAVFYGRMLCLGAETPNQSRLCGQDESRQDKSAWLWGGQISWGYAIAVICRLERDL